MKLHCEHHSFYPFVQALARSSVQMTAYTDPGEAEAVQLIWWKRGNDKETTALEMAPAHASELRTQWQCVVSLPEEIHYLKYYFRITCPDGTVLYADEQGVSGTPGNEQTAYELLQTHDEDVIHTPEWAKGCVFYQIYPDSFSLPEDADQESRKNWHNAPNKDHYLGGTLRGIESRIPYLKELGIGCLYLTPIFEADFTHRYATTDYLKIDPRLGDESDLIHLVDALHQNGIRILLDGVFNHCGNHFAPFMDMVKHGAESRYASWFFPKQFPIRLDAACYECVGDYPFMPRLNGADPGLREYVKSVLLHWLDVAHIDGWRFDVADELDEGAVRYWLQAVREKHPDALMLAETWHEGLMLADGSKHFDCAMNYLFRSAVMDYFALGSISADTFISRLEEMQMRYPEAVNDCMYNLLGSHDTARFLTVCGHDEKKLKMAMAFQMLYPGAPAIYYGDEIGMSGENDPFCRAGMEWDHINQELFQWEKNLIHIRRTDPAVMKGACRLSVQENCLILERKLDDHAVTAVFNPQAATISLNLPVAQGKVDVSAQSVKII